jgi:hypothetical protein
MAIETNIESGAAPTPTAEKTAGFAGATIGASPTGKEDFLSLLSRASVSRIDAAVEPYLEKVKKVLQDNLNNVEMVRLERAANSYVFVYKGEDNVESLYGIQFVSTTDPVPQNYVPQTVKFRLINEEIKERYAGKHIRIVNIRTVIAGYAPDMDRAESMADSMVRSFRSVAVPFVRGANIDFFTTNEFVADWRISEARAMEAKLSGSGVRPRMDIGLTLKAKIRNELGREFRELADDYRNVGVIGGYTEIRDKEMRNINGQNVLVYTPVFVITVMNSEIQIEGVAAILLAALAPTITNTMFWAKQWSELNDKAPQPGLLEKDEDNRNKPVILKDQEELGQFIRVKFASPVIAFELQDGGEIIPGLHNLVMSDANGRQHLMNRLSNFFKVDQVANPPELSRVIETRFDGVVGDSGGTLTDSREFDFLTIAAKAGVGSINDDIRRILLGGSDQPSDRARVISEFTNSFFPLSVGTVAAINPDFIKWIIEQCGSNRLLITDPGAQMVARPFGSILEGFGSSAGMGSIITNGITSRGSSVGSFWS